MKDIKKIFKIVWVNVALIIGAGFASGQELLNFFVKYEKGGILGLIIFSILFSMTCYGVLKLCIQKGYKNQDELISGIVMEPVDKIIKLCVGAFFFILYITMISAAGALAKQTFDINFSLACILIGFVCLLATLYDIEGIIKINSILAPIMTIGIVIVSIYTILYQDSQVFLNNSKYFDEIKKGWFISSVVYTAYNIVTSISVLASMKTLKYSKKIAFYSSVFSGLILLIVGICMYMPILSNFSYVINFEIPFFAVMYKFEKIIQYVYIILMIMAIFTTAVANAYAFFDFAKVKNILQKLFITIVAIMLAHLGFSVFVTKIYPLFGIIGIIQIVSIFLRSIEEN